MYRFRRFFRVLKLPFVLKIALGIMLAGWVCLGLFFLVIALRYPESARNVEIWLSYLFLTLVVALLGTGLSQVLKSLIRPWAERWAQSKPQVVRYPPQVLTLLKIGTGISLGILGLAGILLWSFFLPMIIECRIFQECTPTVLE